MLRLLKRVPTHSGISELTLNKRAMISSCLAMALQISALVSDSPVSPDFTNGNMTCLTTRNLSRSILKCFTTDLT